MKKAMILVVMLLIFSLMCGTVVAESTDKIAGDGIQTVLVDQDGVRIYLTGKHTAQDNFNRIQGNYIIKLECVVENNGTKPIGSVNYTGVINGWSLGSGFIMSGTNNLQPGTKVKTDIWFGTEHTELTAYEQIKTMRLNVTVEDEKRNDMFTAKTGRVRFPNAVETPAVTYPDKRVLIDREDFCLYLTGNCIVKDKVNRIEGNYMIELECIIENKSKKMIGSVSYTGAVNGWSLGAGCNMSNTSNFQANTKLKTAIWFTTKDTDITCYEELESLDLTFTVKNKHRKEMFKEKADKVYFNGAGK